MEKTKQELQLELNQVVELLDSIKKGLDELKPEIVEVIKENEEFTPKLSTEWVEGVYGYVTQVSTLSYKKPKASSRVLENHPKGTYFTFDAYKVDRVGYVWLRIPELGNKYRYVQAGLSLNDLAFDYFGDFVKPPFIK